MTDFCLEGLFEFNHLLVSYGISNCYGQIDLIGKKSVYVIPVVYTIMLLEF